MNWSSGMRPREMWHRFIFAIRCPARDTAAVESGYAIPQTMVRDEWADVSDSYRVALAAASFAEKLRASQYVEELRYADIAALLEGKHARRTLEENELLSSFVKQTSWRIPCVDRSRVR